MTRKRLRMVAKSGRSVGYSSQQSRISWINWMSMVVSFGGIGGRNGGVSPPLTRTNISAHAHVVGPQNYYLALDWIETTIIRWVNGRRLAARRSLFSISYQVRYVCIDIFTIVVINDCSYINVKTNGKNLWFLRNTIKTSNTTVGERQSPDPTIWLLLW